MASSNKNTLIVILGPTGVGKTETCLRVAEYFHIPIINADSRQIFAELPIGTAAPTQEQQRRVKHFFVGSLHLEDYYSASMFEQDALAIIEQQLQEQGIALMSGGSMMYIDAVCNGIDDIPTVNDETRETMKRRLQEEGLPTLVEELRQLDPEHYQIVDKNNPRRVVHALEICHQTGNTYTSFRTNQVKERPFRIMKIGLNRPREELYDRINRRVDEMMRQGLEEEARHVYPKRHLNSLNTVGYRELFDYFDGHCTLEEAVLKIKSNTRRYMRKQLTWFKKDGTIRWFSPDNIEEILNYIANSQ
ncbi:MAG: tRNA (adenosine(37)-N6)-dimethylallyltransferase MiaA [Prevotella sp.]|nr:tRNA (adenosine(37)-N6)-dimethylallyltransferase MiaA [Prevotella sp.]